MARGFLAGLGMGTLVSVLGLTAASLVSAPPGHRMGPAQQASGGEPADQTASASSDDTPDRAVITVAPASEFNRDRPDATPVIPRTDDSTSAAKAPTVAGAAPPDAAPLPDTAPAGAPTEVTQAPSDLAPQAAPGADAAAVPGASESTSEDNGLNFVLTPEPGTSTPPGETVPSAPPPPAPPAKTAAQAPSVAPDMPAPADEATPAPVLQVPDTQTAAPDRATAVSPDKAQTATAEPATTEKPAAVTAQTAAPAPAQDAAKAPAKDAASAAGNGIVLTLGDLGKDNTAAPQPPAPVVAPEAPSPAAPASAEAATPATPPAAAPAGPQPAAPTPAQTVTGTEVAAAEPKLEAAPAQSAPSDETSSAAPATGKPPSVLRLPRIGGDQAATSPEPATPSDETAPADGAPTDQGAIARNAVTFEPTGDLPLLSVVLIDDGGNGVTPETVASLPFVVTMAIPADDPAAAKKAAAYHAAGTEVVLLAPPLERGESASGLKDKVLGYMSSVPDALGLVDAEKGGFQGNRRLLNSVVSALGQDGAGLLVWDRGLNPMQVPQQAGLPAALIFKPLDAGGASAFGIARTLDRAALDAGQQGGAVVIGHDTNSTVKALEAWTAKQLVPSVQFAPLSAVLSH